MAGETDNEKIETMAAAASAGATAIPVADGFGVSAGQPIAIDNGANLETAVIASLTGGGRGGTGGGGAPITVEAPLKLGHTAGATVSGTGPPH